MNGNHTQTFPRSSLYKEERTKRIGLTGKTTTVNPAQSWKRTTTETQMMMKTLMGMMKMIP